MSVFCKYFAFALGTFILMPVAAVLAVTLRVFAAQNMKAPRLVWGVTPIINFSIWSRAMERHGYVSETYTRMFYPINRRSDWDTILEERWRWVPTGMRQFFALLDGLIRFDIFFLSFDGFFLGNTPLWKFELFLLRLARKKTVVLPYGSDVHVYRRIREPVWAHVLEHDYPSSARRQRFLAKRVDHFVDKADVVISGFMARDGVGRSDVLIPSCLQLDLEIWNANARKPKLEGLRPVVRIAHAPNHRAAKGTEFVLRAVDQLKQEGFAVELVLLESMTNEEVRENLLGGVDILVEQLVGIGHGLNGIEGLASGIPTVSNLGEASELRVYRWYSFFDECPIVSANPGNLVEVLRALVRDPLLRNELGNAGRKYAEKYHGLDTTSFLFESVVDYLRGSDVNLATLFHPHQSSHVNRLPKVVHPLVSNQLPIESHKERR